jgi:hypothetical protein
MKNLLKDLTIRKYWWLKLINDKKKSYLYHSGWINSFKTNEPVDMAGNPVPWLSLPIVSFLSERLNNNLKMFEFGCGNSTRYFSKMLKRVDSIEHHQVWFDKIRSKLPSNANVHFYKLGSDYENAANDFDESFDIILVDGRNRVESCRKSINALSDQGVIIFDDFQRKQYRVILPELIQQGFRELPFWGMGSGSIHTKCTSIFYRDHNCLNI